MTTATCSAPQLEHSPAPLGLGFDRPRISWKVTGGDGSWRQTGYELRLTTNGESLSSGALRSSDQLLVDWPFTPLVSRQVASLEVRVLGADEDWSAWSEPTAFEVGLLSPTDLEAEMVSPGPLGGLDDPAPIVWTTFVVRAGVSRARLYATALGIYVARINGARVGSDYFTPGWTSYEHRLALQTYDIGELLRTGVNRIDVTIGNGWYRGNLGRPPRRDLYGTTLAVIVQLEVEYDDGSIDRFASDESWQASPSQIVSDDFYNGQVTDLTLSSGGAHSATSAVPFDKGRIVTSESPPVRVTELLRPVEIVRTASGSYQVDFGQNFVGWVRLRVTEAAGTEVTVRHAEVLEKGELAVRPLRTARATDRYVLGRSSPVTLEPEFTFHGFRYAEISGLTNLQPETVAGVVIGSDLERTGWFDCSNPQLNQLHSNVVWGMRGNFVSVPTDCPQRDERLGWTGDIQIFAPTASFLYDTSGFLDSWLRDLSCEQRDDGSVPYVIPDTMLREAPAAAAWGDASTVVPWSLYTSFADDAVLIRQLESMRKWVEKMDSLAGPSHIWRGGHQYGDWLDPSAPPDRPGLSATRHDLVATACFARSARLLADAEALVGAASGAKKYGRLADEVREAFLREFVTGSGLLVSDTPTAYSLALEWNLIEGASARAVAGGRLADLVRAAGFTIGTGFVGTPLILDALCTTGHEDVAYRLLLQTECPSWLYPVSMGATTIWERWDSMLPDGSVNPGQMTSFNHYAFGAVADWMHRTIAGLSAIEPGYRRFEVRPVPGGGLSYAQARLRTPHGDVEVRWEIVDGRFELAVTVPIGSQARVFLPGANESVAAGPGRHYWVSDAPSPPRSATSGATITTREAIDDESIWNQVCSRALSYRPEWTSRDICRAAEDYFDRPLVEFARVVGSSVVRAEERDFETDLQRIVELQA